MSEDNLRSAYKALKEIQEVSNKIIPILEKTLGEVPDTKMRGARKATEEKDRVQLTIEDDYESQVDWDLSYTKTLARDFGKEENANGKRRQEII